MDGDDRAARVGMRDVARVAGVSTQTVSRVLSGQSYVRDDTRDRVLAAVTELGYRVNNAARSLGTSSSRILGVLASDAALYGPSAGIAALEAAARARGRWISTVYADASDAASVAAATAHLLGQGVDGIILVAAHARTLGIVTGGDPGVPAVALHGADGGRRQADGAALVVEHLAELGHRRVARLGGPADWLEEGFRADGFAGAMTAHGLQTDAAWSGDWSASAGFRVAAEVAGVVRRPAGATAVVVANDQMALGLIAGLRAEGVDVPGDVSVTGFDDNPDAAFYRPALTTVRIDLAGETRRAVADVLAAGGSASGGVEPEPPALVVRASTAAARDARQG